MSRPNPEVGYADHCVTRLTVGEAGRENVLRRFRVCRQRWVPFMVEPVNHPSPDWLSTPKLGAGRSTPTPARSLFMALVAE
jgi:hypothetical protein